MNIFLSLISGILLTLSFPEYDLYPLAWISLTPLLYCLHDASARRAFLYGLITGLCFNLTAFHWFFSHFLIRYSLLPWYGSLGVYLILALYLSLYYSFFAGLVVVSKSRFQIPLYLSAPFLFVALEFLRSKAFTGFPWELLGYSQYKFIPLIQIADITGVYGISFLIISFNSILATILRERFRFNTSLKAATLGFFVIILLTISYGYLRLHTTNPGVEGIRVSLIQGNIKMEEKLSKDLNIQKSIIDRYGRMTVEALKDRPDIIVWPETAMPFIYGLHKESTKSLLEFQKRIGVALLTGIISSDHGRVSNSVIYIAGGRVIGQYKKMKLVPFGEYDPFNGAGKLIENLDYDKGRSFTVFDHRGRLFSVMICYEIIFPELARNFVMSGARLLIAVSNDAWFGDSSAPYQHFSMAVFRAIENRVPLARVANTGVSGVIDSNGRIRVLSDTFIRTVITEEIKTDYRTSLYSRYGDLFSYLVLVSILLKLFHSLYRKRYTSIKFFS